MIIAESGNVPILCYQAVAATKSGVSCPVMQLLSSKGDSKTITSWLDTFVDAVVRLPKEIVIDDIEALVLGTVNAFTEFNTLESYLNKCHLMLSLDGDKQIKEISQELPKCYIRLEGFNFMRNLQNSCIFQKCDDRVKKFFLLAIGVVFVIDDFKVLKNIVENILILSMCQFESELTENSRKNLKEMISVNNIIELFTKINQFQEKVLPVENDKIIPCPDKVKIDWFNEIKEEVFEIADINKTIDDKENLYYFPSLLTLLDTIIYKVPLWSPVMTKLFQSPNLNVCSWINETKFKHLKRNIFDETKTLRIDKFLFGQITEIIKTLDLAVADLNNKKLKPKGIIVYCKL